jgi:hypothetical protein
VRIPTLCASITSCCPGYFWQLDAHCKIKSRWELRLASAPSLPQSVAGQVDDDRVPTGSGSRSASLRVLLALRLVVVILVQQCHMSPPRRDLEVQPVAEFFYGHVPPVAVAVALVGMCVHRWSRPFLPDGTDPVRACTAEIADDVQGSRTGLEVCYIVLDNPLVCKGGNKMDIGISPLKWTRLAGRGV